MDQIKDKAAAARHKVTAKLKKTKPPLKITNDTIAEHREKILAGGRKFKYPLQYSKHKILINAIVVTVIALVAFGIWLWAMLYKVQSTGDFFYSTTRFLPLPVANIDGQAVPYSDYLRRIRADIYYYENQENKSFTTTDGQRELNYNKRKELDAAERSAYSSKVARLRKITVSDAEVDAKINAMHQIDGSDQASVSRMLKSYYNWTMDEYRQAVRDQLLEQKVVFAVDSDAKKRVESIEAQLKAGQDFAAIAQSNSDDPIAKQTGGAAIASSGDLDTSGLIAAARQLEVGQISDVISGRDVEGNYCYFIVKLDAKSDQETRYSVITVKLSQFDKDFQALKDNQKINEFIEVSAE
jgi:parvulin-like peptidyl-prolyl isomerase